MRPGNPLFFEQVIARADFADSVGPLLRLEDVDVFDVGLGLSAGKIGDKFRDSLERSIAGALSAGGGGAVLDATAEQIADYFHVFAETKDAKALYFQDRVRGPVVRFDKIDPRRLQVDPTRLCPLGHQMPQDSSDREWDDMFQVSTGIEFDEAAKDFASAVYTYFELDQKGRRGFLDELWSGLPEDSDAYLLQASYRLKGAKLRRCTARCGFLNYHGAQWYGTPSAVQALGLAPVQ